MIRGVRAAFGACVRAAPVPVITQVGAGESTAGPAPAGRPAGRCEFYLTVSVAVAW